jgi:hypothetical protein
MNAFLPQIGTCEVVCAIHNADKFSILPHYIQAILNSKYVEWFCNLTEIFLEEVICKRYKVLNNLPIRTIDFADAKKKSLHNKIVETQKNLSGYTTR